MSTLRLLPCLAVLTICASCSSGGPVTDSRRIKNVMAAPNTPLQGDLMTPGAYNNSSQKARLQKESLSYRRAANTATTNEEREKFLQMAESLDQQAAALPAQ